MCVNSWTELRRAASRVAGWAVSDVASMPSGTDCRFMRVQERKARAERKH